MLKRLLPLLALLFALPAFSQVVIEDRVVEVDTTTGFTGPLVETAWDPPDTTDMIVTFAGGQATISTFTVTWDGAAMTQAATTTFSGAGGDTGVIAFCRQAPTVTSGNLSFDWSLGNTNAFWMVSYALSGTAGGSCGSVVTELAESVDDAAASLTSVFGTAGASPNKGFIACSAVGADVDSSNNAGWTEDPAEFDTGGGSGVAEDFSAMLATGDLPAAVTITQTVEDEHACLYVSIAADAVGTIAPLAYQYQQENQ